MKGKRANNRKNSNMYKKEKEREELIAMFNVKSKPILPLPLSTQSNQKMEIAFFNKTTVSCVVVKKTTGSELRQAPNLQLAT
jgi:hypothetical protein